MAEIRDLNVVDAANTARFPEGQAPSTVNDGARAGEGFDARAYKDTIDTTLASTGTGNAYLLTTNRNPPDAGPALYNGLTLTFEANHANTGAATLAVTLNTAAQLAKPIVDIAGAALTGGEIPVKGVVTVVFRETDDHFMLISPVGVGNFAKLDAVNRFTQQQQWIVGTEIASAATLAIPDDGNAFKVTGSITITAFSGSALGTWIWLEFDGTPTIEHSASLLLNNGGSNIDIEVGDRAVAIRGPGDVWSVWILRASGQAVAPSIQPPYESPQQTIVAGSSVVLAHGLGAKPTFYSAFLQCVTAEHNWSAGEEVSIDAAQISSSSTVARGCSLSADATNITIVFGNNPNGFLVHNKSTGDREPITNSSWRVVVRAWA